MPQKNKSSSFGLSFSNPPSLSEVGSLCDYPRLVQRLLTSTSSRFSSIFQSLYCNSYFSEIVLVKVHDVRSIEQSVLDNPHEQYPVPVGVSGVFQRSSRSSNTQLPLRTYCVQILQGNIDRLPHLPSAHASKHD